MARHVRVKVENRGGYKPARVWPDNTDAHRFTWLTRRNHFSPEDLEHIRALGFTITMRGEHPELPDGFGPVEPAP